MHRYHLLLSAIVAALALAPLRAEPLPETKPLTREGDLAAQMVEGIDKYLMRELAASVERRKQYWKPDFSSVEAYRKSVQPNRERLRKILGVVDQRVSPVVMEYVSEGTTSPLVAETETYKVYSVRWPVLPGVDGEGLLLEPKGKVTAQVVALPDADWTPEMAVGLAPGVPKEAQFARRLAENGCRVIVPVLIDRKDTWSGNPTLGRMTNQTHREFIYRMAYEMGRHVIGYEVQKVLAAVDWFCREKDHSSVGVFGFGEGGLLALYAAAFDPRIRASVVSGYRGPHVSSWQEPIYRNLFGIAREWGTAQLALLVMPRHLILDCSKGPEGGGPPAARAGRSGAAPGRFETATRKNNKQSLYKGLEDILEDIQKVAGVAQIDQPLLVSSESDWPGDQTALSILLSDLMGKESEAKPDRMIPSDTRKNFDPAPRQKRQFDQLVAFTQKLMRDSERYRQQHFWANLDKSSLEKYKKSC